MPLISDYPPIWVPDPPGNLLVSGEDQAIHGAIMLGAFAAVGIGVFYSASVVNAAIWSTGVGDSLTINGVTYYGVSQSDLTVADVLVNISEGGADGAGGAGASILALCLETSLLDGVANGTVVAAGGTIGGAGLTPAVIAAASALLIELAASIASAGAMGGFFPSGMGH